jgi:hypothetical protein
MFSSNACVARDVTADGVYTVLIDAPASSVLTSRAPDRALRATAATNAPEHNADIARAQQWLGREPLYYASV